MTSIPEIIKEEQLPNKFRPATPEESAKFDGIEGQIDESTNRFYPVQESSPELKVKLLKQAAKFYSEGNSTEALIYATAAGVGGMWGDLTIAELERYFGVPSRDSSPPTDGRRSLDEIIPSKKE